MSNKHQTRQKYKANREARNRTRTPADNGEPLFSQRLVPKLIEQRDEAVRVLECMLDQASDEQVPAESTRAMARAVIAKIKAVSVPVSDDFSKTLKTHETIEKIGRDGEI